MNRETVKKIIFTLTIFPVLIISMIFFILYKKVEKDSSSSDGYDDLKQEYLVDLNEVGQLYKMQDASAEEKLNDVIRRIRQNDIDEDNNPKYVVIISYITCLIILAILYIYIYLNFLRPFDKLESYAEEIAKGNLDKTFDYNRKNIFGKFTWAFDHMRIEIINSRKNERAAIENNKTVIATLSHDIKTPVASIRGYAEGLTMNMDSNPDRRKRYADVIIKKCDEVARITDDLFIHSLHDLDKLEIKEEIVDLKMVIQDTIDNLQIEGDIKLLGVLDEGKIERADKNRIAQVIENIISNSRKYAETSIEVSSRIIRNDDNILVDKSADTYIYELVIRDFGPGISNEDMPFVFQKFYRGKAVSDKQGAGLGLFIVKYIMTRIGGTVRIENCSKGLKVHLYFELLKS